MKLPDSAVKQIEAMVHSFLPYESDYKPKTRQSCLVGELFKAITGPNPQLQQWDGFVMYLMKEIDSHPHKQNEADNVASTAYDILDAHGYAGFVRS